MRRRPHSLLLVGGGHCSRRERLRPLLALRHFSLCLLFGGGFACAVVMGGGGEQSGGGERGRAGCGGGGRSQHAMAHAMKQRTGGLGAGDGDGG
jgi:hypothetical protein